MRVAKLLPHMSNPDPHGRQASVFGPCRRILGSPWALMLFFLGVGLCIYGPALKGDLIWDDNFLVRDNPMFRSPVLAIEAFKHWLSLDFPGRHYRPVQNVSYM